MPVPVTILIPLDEMSPGAVGAIRNQVISGLVRKAASELSMPEDRLVVRDVRPANDLRFYSAGTTTSGVDEWLYDATTTTANAYTSVTGDATMGDQRYVALFGLRDLRKGIGIHTTSMNTMDATTNLFTSATDQTSQLRAAQVVTYVQVSVGGSIKAIWDATGMEIYQNAVSFSPYAVVIPQNSTYNISYYFNSTAAGLRAWLQLIGIVVEPRGRVTSP